MKISIIGDSFCADMGNDPYPSWLYLLKHELPAEILCKGMKGAPLIHSFIPFEKNLSNSDLVIICVTDPGRIPNKYEISLAQGAWDYNSKEEVVNSMLKTAETIDSSIPVELSPKEIISERSVPITEYEAEKLYDSIISFNKWIRHDEFMKIQHRALLREMEYMIKKENKNVIWFRNFESSWPKWKPRIGVWGNKNLRVLPKDGGFSGEINHLSQKDNDSMFKFIKKIIEDDDYTPREIKMECP